MTKEHKADKKSNSENAVKMLQAIDNSGVRTFMYYPQSKKITIPEKTCEAYRCKAVYENMPQSFADDFVHPDDHEAFNELYYRIDRGEETSTTRFHSKDLKFCHNVTLTTMNYTSQGEPKEVFGVIENINDDIKNRAVVDELRKQLQKKNVSNTAENQEIVNLIASSIGDMYHAIYHISLETNTFMCFREEFLGTTSLIGAEGNYEDAWITYVESLVLPEYQSEMYKFGDIKTLGLRLHDTDIISKNFNRKNLGWIQGQFIAAKRNDEGTVTNVILTVRSINEEIKLEEQRKNAEFAAEHDPLTGLYNRKGFERISASESFTHIKTGFMLIDIDNFKALNDCHGHDMGDQVLVAVADGLKQIFRDDDRLFRLGGDELAILLYHCDERIWEIVCNKMRTVHAMLKKMFSDGLDVDITMSVGLCFSENGFDDAMHLLADEALYVTKRNGRAGCSLINQDHEILRTWRDEDISIHTKTTLEYTNSGMYRMEIPVDNKKKPSLICGEETKMSFGAPADLTPEECYQFWENGVDPEYRTTLNVAVRAMVESGQSECTYKWNHPKWGTIYVRSSGFGEVKDGIITLTGYHHVLKDTNLIEKHDEKELIFRAWSNVYAGMYYLNLEDNTYSSFKVASSEDYLEVSSTKMTAALDNYISVIVAADDRQKMKNFMDMDTLQARLQNNKCLDCEYRSVPLHSWCRARLVPIKFDENGKLIRVLFTVSKLDSDKARELYDTDYNRKSLSALFNNVPGGIVMYEWDGKTLKTIHISEYYSKQYGYSLVSTDGDNIGGPDFERVHPDDVEEYKKAILHALEDTHVIHHEYRVWNKEADRYVWVKIDATSEPQPDGNSLVFAIYTDITEQKELGLNLEKNRISLMAALKSYEDRLHSLLSVKENTLSMCTVNLTQNTFEMVGCQNIMERFVDEAQPFDIVFMSVVDKIAGTEMKKAYQQIFSREHLLEEAEKGNMHVQMEYLLNVSDGHNEWITAAIDMAQNPITGEITGVAYSKSIQEQKMSNALLEKALKQDYLFAAVVFTDTDEFYLYDSVHGEFSERKSDYWRVALERVKPQYNDDLYNRLTEIFRKERILEHLEHEDAFTYAFDRQRNGERYRLEVRFSYMDEGHTMILASMRDITDDALIAKLRHDNEHDPLTDLFNRNTVFRKCSELLKTHPEDQFAMIHIDMRHFRLYNTFFGDSVGDKLLCDVADLLREMSKDYDYWVYGRIEADVFCAFFPYDRQKYQGHLAMCLEYLKDYRTDFLIEPVVGIYFVTDREMPIEAMFTRATLAAKEVRPGTPYSTVIYDETLEKELNDNQQIVSEMQTAIEAEQFEVYLQPKYSLRSNKLIGAEALVRWNHPIKGIVSPGKFIPIFEGNGFITTLDRYMWEHVCKLIRKWKDEGKLIAPISVNVSRLSMFATSTVDFLKNLIRKYDIDPKYLELELTESAYMDDPEEMKAQMTALRNAGFTILMDDFGSGYSSLNALRELPVDVLKMDMKFLSMDSQDIRGGLVISSIVRMSKLLDLVVIAEGVEFQEQADFLKEIGCENVQGFLYSRPMPVQEYEKLLTNAEEALPHVNQPRIDHVGHILAETGTATYELGSVMPSSLACLEYSNGEFTFLRVNSEFLEEFELAEDTNPVSGIFKKNLSENSYAALIQAFEDTVESEKKTQVSIVWNCDDGTQRRYACHIAYEGSIGATAILVAVFTNITEEVRKYTDNPVSFS